jgi:Ca2+/Na+ antiporter
LEYIDILYIIVFSIIIFVEPLIIKEDVSYLKLITRMIGTVMLLLLFVWSDYLQISPSIMKINMYLLGYCIVSVIFQFYSLSYPRPELQSEPNETILKTKE